jgi:excisionase family DNA binding protein
MDELVTVKEAMAMLRLSRKTLYLRTREGTVPSVRIGSRRLYRKTDLIELTTPSEKAS